MVKARTRLTTRGAGGGKGTARSRVDHPCRADRICRGGAQRRIRVGAGARAPAAAAPAAPDLATRVADLEAYVTNGAPKALSVAGSRATTPG